MGSEATIKTNGATSLNLQTTDSVSEWIPVGLFNKFTCEIIKHPDSTWASAEVDLQWALCTDAEADRATAFNPAVQATTTYPYIANASVTNRGYVRLKTSTAEALNDAAAKVVWSLK